jgi:hypothetical protein
MAVRSDDLFGNDTKDISAATYSPPPSDLSSESPPLCHVNHKDKQSIFTEQIRSNLRRGRAGWIGLR